MNIQYTDTAVGYNVDRWKREGLLKTKLEEFASCELVITDRLHGIIFAFITNTPCIALDSLSYKNNGICKLLSKNATIKFVENIDCIEEAIRDLQTNNVKYLNDMLLEELVDKFELIEEAFNN